MKSITDMISAELRIACAEKCGWRIEEEQNIVPVEKSIFRIYHNNYFCEMIKEYSSAINLLKRQYYPDYEHDMNTCMELMEKIWEKKPGAFIEQNGINWWQNDLQFGIKKHEIKNLSLPIAVMRAFLTVMEDN